MKTKDILLLIGLFAAALFSVPAKAQVPQTEYAIAKMTISDAIQGAEEYLKREKMDTSRHVITAVVYKPHWKMQTRYKTETGNSEGRCWAVTYTLKISSDGGEIFVFLFEDGSIGHIHGM